MKTVQMNGSWEVVRDREYFLRQMRLPGVGEAGQIRLQNARVVVVGLGALGCPVVEYLARSGIGGITLFDGDVVSYHNLHRQTLYRRSDVGRLKAEVAGDYLRREFPDLEADIRPVYMEASSGDLFSALQVDAVLDCTDRFSSRFAVHDVALENRLNLVSGAVSSTTGQLFVLPFARSAEPCLRCLYPEVPPDGCTGSCGEDGILGASAGVMGSLQALAALRLILGLPGPVESTVHSIDLTSLEVSSALWEKNPNCRYCRSAGTSAGAGLQTERPGQEVHSERSEKSPRIPKAVETAPGEGTRVIDLREVVAPEPRRVDREGLTDLFFPEAERIPGTVFRSMFTSLNREQPFLLICEQGVLSRELREEMVRAGFEHVADVAGGYAGLMERIRQT